MKRCPECRRDYYDETLLYCLEDGVQLVQGSVPVSQTVADEPATRGADEPATAILHTTDAVGEAPTRAQIHTTEQTAVFPSGVAEVPKRGLDKRLLASPLLLAIVALGGFFGYKYFSPTKQIESIAVMPFVNESGNPDVEYLSDGMTETLISSLAHLPSLNVKARSTVFHYKGKDVSPQTVGNELSVQAILNGRVVQRGDQLTLSLELVDTKTGNQIWGEQYNRKLTDLVALQSEIGRDVSRKLRIRLSNTDEQRVAKTYTTNPEAYQLYLQGLYYWNKRTGNDIRKSIVLFQQATEKDPSYAQAYAGLALAYNVLPKNSAVTKEEATQLKLKEAAALHTAQELDDSLAEVHVELAQFRLSRWDFAAAEDEFKRAIELNPNFATAHQWYADFLASMGRHEEAVIETNKAHEIDPFSRVINAMIGMRSFEARDLDGAIAQYKKVIEMEPDYPLGHAFLADVYRAKGMYAEAIAEFSFADRDQSTYAAARQLLKTGGPQGLWRKRLELSRKSYEQGNGSAIEIAEIYAELGDKDRAFEWLEKSFAAHEDELADLKIKPPAFDGLRSDPRFQDLLRRVGLPQ